MTIILNLTEDRERKLREMTTQLGQDEETVLLSLLDEAPLSREADDVFWDSPEERAEALAGVQRGLDDFAAGRYRSVDQVFADMKARHGIPD